MRIPLVVGNWKMYTDREGAIKLAEGLKSEYSAKGIDSSQIKMGVCPPAPFIPLVKQVLEGHPLQVGGQNLYPGDEGAYTGEVSGKMLRSLGCHYVILGHSERRKYFGETDEGVNKKITAALSFHLTPIVCVGETLEEREAGKMKEVVTSQMTKSLEGFSGGLLSSLVIAYEPVWAIGTGVSASPEDAEEMHQHIRTLLSSLGDDDLAAKIPLLYGGSVKGSNALELSGKPNIDGALVGGASLKAGDFIEIAQKVVEAKKNQ